MKKLVIIDGKSVFYRGYYAMPNLSMSDGTPTGGVYGFAALSLELIKQLNPDYVCVAWDKAKTNISKRRAIYPEYKAGRRPAPADFYTQIPLLQELLETMGWPLYELDDYEADDIMATLDAQAEERGDLETFLITSDLDALQILDKNTFLYALKRGFSQIDKFDVAGFEDKYGIKINQFLDLKSLMGDSSDNIPGVPGVGQKTATQLLQDYGTLEGIYENLDSIKTTWRSKLEAGRELAFMSKELSRLYVDAPIALDLDAMDVRDMDPKNLAALLRRFEFSSLLERLPEYMQVLGEDVAEEAIERSRAELVDWSEAEATNALMSSQVLLQVIDGKLYLSTEASRYSQVSASVVETIIKNVFIITHGGDALCKYLLSENVPLPKTMFDTRQAGFLINPLVKSRTVSDVTGYSGEEIDVIVAELWSAYQRQTAELEKLPLVKQIAEEIDFPLIPLLAQMEHVGITLDTEQLAAMNLELQTEIDQLQAEMHKLAGTEFNISSPSQLAEVLYVNLALPTAGIKKGKTGYSTGQKELDKLRGQHPIIELIERYRELTKLQNTYVVALPKLVDSQSRLHTTFNQDVAATGRLSSTDPNLQNIPIRTEQGRRIRQAFVPAAGNVFVSADYSQFELRLAAVLSGDEDMINDFNAGTDIHTKTAADIHGVPIDEVTKEQRRDAKVINFGVLYGMGPHALAQNTGMNFGQAKTFIDDYFKLRHKVRSYIDQTIEQAREQGYVETYYGRRRPTPDVNSSNFMVRSGAERAAANMPIQGTEADLMKKAMLRVEEQLRGSAVHSGVQRIEIDDSLPAENRAPRSTAEPLGWQVLQIHDSILVECPAENAEQVSQILQSTMESIAPELPIKLNVDVSVGKTWGEV